MRKELKAKGEMVADRPRAEALEVYPNSSGRSALKTIPQQCPLRTDLSSGGKIPGPVASRARTDLGQHTTLPWAKEWVPTGL